MNKQFVGPLAMFICGIVWSTAGLFIKILEWHPLVIAGGRSLIAALFLIPVRFALYGTKDIPWKRPAFWLAGIFYALTMLFFVIASKLTSSANAIILQYSAPVWTALFGWFIIKEKPSARQWIAIVMVLAGLYIIFGRDLTSGSPLGDGLAILSGIFYGLNGIFLRKQKDANPLDSMWMSNLLLGLGCIPYYIKATPVWTGMGVFSIFFLGIAQIGLASCLYSYAVKRIRAVSAMLIAEIEPLLNPVWVFAVTGESPSIFTLYGGAVILAAVILAGWPSKTR
jgi:drug/metabolite transporter (DMT)-like permease